MCAKKTEPKLGTDEKILNMARNVHRMGLAGDDPVFQVPSRTLANVNFNEVKRIIEMGEGKTNREFFNLGQSKKFMQTMLVAEACNRLVAAGKTNSIRDLYYMTKHTIAGTRENTFDDQAESDPIIEDLEVTLDSLREELHLFASNKGAMVGEITLVDGGDTIDARRMGTGGWSVPSIVEPDVVQFKECEAKFILLVEKDAMWRRLNEDKFWKLNHCILIHGGGQPPRGVRRLMHRMHYELGLPLYVFVDNDPWGYYIYSVVKQGSISLAYESRRMAIPKAKFIGLSSADVEKYQIPSEVTIRLEDTDIARAKEIMAYPWFAGNKVWQKEIQRMLSSKVKLELEALSAKGITFASDEYLPRKLKEKDFLD